METLEVERSVRGVPRVWLPDAGIAVSLRDVWMRHRDDRPDQLVGVTVDLPRRGLTAVVGPSGGERQRIAKVARTTSVVVVAHRLSTVVAADRILVMECGRLRAAGTHAELVAADDRYRTLAVTQLLGDETDSSAPTGRHAFVPGSRALKVDCKAAQDGYRLEIDDGRRLVEVARQRCGRARIMIGPASPALLVTCGSSIAGYMRSRCDEGEREG